ncbi:MAG: SRPBCC family protein [Chloroflexi bacterium]|nr:SRPBCC family protein [Chloroflexota bacterium]
MVFRPLLALGALASALYALKLRPWFLHWGATADEAAQPLSPGEAPPRPALDATRAVTIDAPVEAVWPWIAQLGQDRAGFYSYAWLENLAGAEIRNSDRIDPAWQERAIGELVHLHPRVGLKVTAFEPLRVMSLENSWSFALQPIDGRTTRLLVRSRAPRGMGVLFNILLLELPHFIMERKMLLGIKERAERA